jgi:hypothetical protein
MLYTPRGEVQITTAKGLGVSMRNVDLQYKRNVFDIINPRSNISASERRGAGRAPPRWGGWVHPCGRPRAGGAAAGPPRRARPAQRGPHGTRRAALTPGRPPPLPPPAGNPEFTGALPAPVGAPPPGGGGLPMWAVVLIVLAAALFGGAMLLAIVGPRRVGRCLTGECGPGKGATTSEFAYDGATLRSGSRVSRNSTGMFTVLLPGSSPSAGGGLSSSGGVEAAAAAMEAGAAGARSGRGGRGVSAAVGVPGSSGRLGAERQMATAQLLPCALAPRSCGTAPARPATPSLLHTHDPAPRPAPLQSMDAPGDRNWRGPSSTSSASAGAGAAAPPRGRDTAVDQLHAAVAALNREIDDKSLIIHEVLGQGAYGV